MKICILTAMLKSGLSRFTSPVKIIFAWNIVLASFFLTSISGSFPENFLKSRLQKRMLIFFDVSYDFQGQNFTPSAKLRPCTLWTVHAHGNVNRNCVLFTDCCCLFLRRPNNAWCFFLVPNYVVELSHLIALPLFLHYYC